MWQREGCIQGRVAFALHGFFALGGDGLCLYPNKRYQIGFHESGKPKYLIESRFTDRVAETFDGRFIPLQPGSPLPPFDIRHLYTDGLITPCGQCLECRINKSKEWANRLMIERQYHDSAYFITLTYDDLHVPRNVLCDPLTGEPVLDPETGDLSYTLTLDKPAVSAFIKRLRRALEYRGRSPIRFYACGEYGSQTARPHYHLIVFGLDLPDLKLFRCNFRGEKYYRSALVEQCWRDKDKQPIGHVLIADCTWETCAYVARYVVKKFTGDLTTEYYTKMCIEPEFSLMSRKPGIARDYYDEHKSEIYAHDELNISTGSRGILTKPPSYYDRLYDVEAPSEMYQIKERRRETAEARAQIQARATPGYTDEQRLEIKRMVLRAKHQTLRRDTV